MPSLQSVIEHYFAEQQSLNPTAIPEELSTAIEEVFIQLEQGTLRVAIAREGEWVVNDWLKKAVLLSFKLFTNEVIDTEYCQFYDKVPLRFRHNTAAAFRQLKIRIVPGAIVRRGSFIGCNSILMPSFVNIGAYIDEGVMVDTWATVGSCAQIGKNVHLSGGVGIGGVLEPLQAQPTIIEDNCFIGARSEIVEGVIVERDSVISMGVYIGQSTKIYNRLTQEITYGRIPAGSVVVPGNLPADDGSHSLYCAVIVKQVDAKTRQKVSINELLR